MDSYNVVMLLLRVVIGATIFLHGYNHVFGPGGIKGTAGWFESMGLKPGIVHAWASGGTEMAAGAGLVLGLLTTLDCAAIISIMVVAGITAHRKNGFFIFKPGQGYEYVLVLATTAFAIATFGPGKLSIDRDLKLDHHLDGSTGAWLSLAIGIGSAVLLLAGAWRPSKDGA